MSFSYQAFGEPYPSYEKPFLGVDIVWWYIALVGVFLVPCLLITVPSYCCCRHCRCCILCPCNKKRNINRVINSPGANEIKFSESDAEPASDIHADEFEEGDGIR